MNYNPFEELKLEETKANVVYQVNIEGSLALLAAGEVGLKLWRKAKEEYLKNINIKNDEK